MNKQQLYDYMWRKLEDFGRKMDVETRTEFDGVIDTIAGELSQKEACEPSASGV